MEYAILFIIILAVLKESHHLNPEIFKYDQYMKDFEATGRRIKQEAKDQKMDGLVMKRESSSSTLPSSKSSAENEEEWIRIYGTDKTSGEWELICNFPYGSEKLVAIAQEAHRHSGLKPLNITVGVKESRWLVFHDVDKYPHLKIDVLVYADESYVRNDTKMPYFFYITKGLKPDCVYYLEQDDLEALGLTLGKHVCGVSLPSS